MSRRSLEALQGSSLDARDLLERVDDFRKIGLCSHGRFDRLVGRRAFVEYRSNFLALDTVRRRRMLGQADLADRLTRPDLNRRPRSPKDEKPFSAPPSNNQSREELRWD
jgi:hypothetical protein